MSVFLLRFISNESSWITLIGSIIAFAGFFYISYEMLDRPHGSLRMILLFALFVLIPVFIVPLPFLLLTFIFWGNSILREIGLVITLYAALLSGMIGGFYGIFVLFHELSPDWSRNIKRLFSGKTLLSWRGHTRRLLRPARRKNRFSGKTLLSWWRSIKQFLHPSRAKLRVSPKELVKGALIGFIWLSVYWLLFCVLFLRISLSQALLPVILTCGLFGAVAGGVWLGYIHKRLFPPASDLLLQWRKRDRVIFVDRNGHPITASSAIMQRTVLVDRYGNPFPQAQPLTQNGDTTDIDQAYAKLIKPAIFSKKDARKGGCFWLLLPFGIVAALLLPGGALLYLIAHASPLAVLLVSLVTAAILGIGSFFSGWFVGGIARFAAWWIEYCSKKTLGYVGIILTVLGLVVGLVVPAIAIAGTSFAFQTNASYVRAVAWSPDDTHIAAGTSDGTVQIWDVITGQRLLTYSSDSIFVNAVAWSPDGTRIASGGLNGTVQVWDAATGKRFLTYNNQSYSGYTGYDIVDTVAWSPDGTRIASGYAEGTVQIWNSLTGQHILTYDSNTNSNNTNPVNGVTWSPDGKRIASGGSNDTVQVWYATTGQKICTYSSHSNEVNAVAWSPDGTRIASGSNDNTVQVWNANTCRSLLTYSGHSDWVNAVAWSPDGTRIVSGSNDGTIQVWGAFTGDHISTYQSNSFNTSSVNALAWSHDGTHIMSGSNDGTVRIWTV